MNQESNPKPIPTIDRPLYIVGTRSFQPPCTDEQRQMHGDRVPVMILVMLSDEEGALDEDDPLTVGAVLLEQLTFIPACSQERMESCDLGCIEEALNELVMSTDVGPGHGVWIPRNEDETFERIEIHRLSGDDDPESDTCRAFQERLSFDKHDRSVFDEQPHLKAAVAIAAMALTGVWPEKHPSAIDE